VVWVELLEVQQAVQVLYSTLKTLLGLGIGEPGHLHTHMHQCGSKSNGTLLLCWCTEDVQPLALPSCLKTESLLLTV
jgi:hypothetical protein